MFKIVVSANLQHLKANDLISKIPSFQKVDVRVVGRVSRTDKSEPSYYWKRSPFVLLSELA